MKPPVTLPSEFTPMQGLLSIGRKLAEHFGFAHAWPGNDGIEGVMRQKLSELGVPEKAIPLAPSNGLTPRQMAEQSGFIRKARPRRRLKV